MGVAAEGDERLLRAVAGGGEAVRAEADPGEERRQGEVVEDLRVEGVAFLPDDEAAADSRIDMSGPPLYSPVAPFRKAPGASSSREELYL